MAAKKSTKLCECGCGNFTNIASKTQSSKGHIQGTPQRLLPGHNKTHGHCRGRKTPEYNAWRSMKKRCLLKTYFQYKFYGGRGISICERWMTFENFLADMGKRPDGLSLERTDNEKGYSADNCIWATPAKQANNRRSNHVIEHAGITMTMTQWANKYSITVQLLYGRLKRGWSMERALTAPAQVKTYRSRTTGLFSQNRSVGT